MPSLIKGFGFGLIEIFVALVVLAVGLLGLASLQGVALTRNNESYLRQQAALLAYDIADRMRANMAGVRNPINNNASSYHMSSTSVPTIINCLTSCTAAQQANNDIAEWANRLAAVLPGGIGILCIDNTPDGSSIPAPTTTLATLCDTGPNAPLGTAFAAKIWWNEKGLKNENDVHQKFFVLSFRP